MATDNVPVSGGAYTLAQLLGGDLQLVIPAIQRDYCWGSDNVSAFQPREKVTAFIKGLLNLYIYDHETTLGLLYGYTDPAGSNNINIIDGQQRITTLYLLIGMLYRRTPTDELRRMLISDYAMIDDREPSLVYRTRNEAMFFISDLVMNFFINRDGRLSMLEKSPWYCKAYDSDATVQSFIGALRRIDEALEVADLDAEWDFDSFAYFVTNKLAFLYYDLGSRSNAEQMYITINTTGEPLTRPQNLKAMLLAVNDDPKAFISRWESMQSWFWKHRRHIPGCDLTSDAGFDYLISLWLYTTGIDFAEVSKSSDINTLRMYSQTLYDLFLSYSYLVEHLPAVADFMSMSSDDLFMIMPMVAYVSRWQHENTPIPEHDLQRLWLLLTNVRRYTKPATSGADMAAAVDMVLNMPDTDILSVVTDGEPKQSKVLNSDEITQLLFIASHPDRRLLAEQLIERARQHPMICGRCARIISWCASAADSNDYDLDVFSKYIDAIYDIWGVDTNDKAELDDLRRALLTIPSRGYPIVRRGDTILSLCWHDYDWQRLMTSSPGIVRQLVDRVIARHIPVKDALRDIADKYSDRSNPFFFLIKNPALMASVAMRRLVRPAAAFIGFKDAGDGNNRWFVAQSAIKVDTLRWSALQPYGTHCLYTRHRRLDVMVALYNTPEGATPYRIDISTGKNVGDTQLVNIDMQTLAQLLPPKFTLSHNRHSASFADASSAIAALHTVLKNL